MKKTVAGWLLLSFAVSCAGDKSGGNGSGGGGSAGVAGESPSGGDTGGSLAGMAGTSGETSGDGGSDEGGSPGTSGAGAGGGSAGMGGSEPRPAACAGLDPYLPDPNAGKNARDIVHGSLIQFNDNGAWSWYQDERAVVDVAGGKLLIGSDSNTIGVGGSTRDHLIEAAVFDLKSGSRNRYNLSGALNPDDHNAPALLVRPDGRYLAMYAGHNQNNSSYYRIFDGSMWSPQVEWDWNAKIPGGTDYTATYSNLWYLSAENRIYDFTRTDQRSPNMMVSVDQGDTWTYGGLLTQPDMSVGYVNGYFKYWGNGVDRIDFIGTEHHPRDFNTSIYHGYLRRGQTFNSNGTLSDDDISDQIAKTIDSFTPVFRANTIVAGVMMTRAWTIDVQRYDDGTVTALFSARNNESETDHRFLYGRFDGLTWRTTYLGKAGTKLYTEEQDYTGLGALHPNDPNTVYISTTFDPRNDADLRVHEIFKGTSSDGGVSFTWTPITEKSVRDNLRPIVPAWNANNTALLWWRGTYSTAQIYEAAVVGVLDRRSETVGPLMYADATTANTKAGGMALTTTGPDGNAGVADGRWHERTGFGNCGSVLTSAEAAGENAPPLTTTVTVPAAGTYDVWVDFWADPAADWRIEAGLTESGMQIFRQVASQQVELSTHSPVLLLSGPDNAFLYRAYAGRVTVAGLTFDVVVDDEAIATGTQTQAGNTVRTVYDGISFARITSN